LHSLQSDRLMGDKVTEISKYVTQVEHESAHKERRHELRRESDRIDRLRLETDELKRIVVGGDGKNGLKSIVALHGALLSRIERLLWAAGCLALPLAAWFARGSIP